MGLKRILLTVFAGIIFTLLLHPLYIYKKAIRIDLSIDTDKEVMLNFSSAKSPDGAFDAGSNAQLLLSAQKQQSKHIKINAKRIRKLKIELPPNSGTVTFGRFSIKGRKKYVLNSFSAVTAHNVKILEAPTDKISVRSTGKDAYLTISDLNYKAGRGIDFKIFMIAVFLSFLFSYHLISYLSRFKLIEQNSRIDIVFLSIFFILLLIPGFKIDDSFSSRMENRVLASFPHLFKEPQHRLNNKFGKEFDTWFNDRFFGRKLLFSIHRFSKFYINTFYQNAYAFRGYDNWITPHDFLPKLKFAAEQFPELDKSLLKFKSFCQDNHIKCYILAVPFKTNFMLDKTYKVLEPDFSETSRMLQQHYADVAQIKVVFPLDEMLEADKTEPVYFKTDHHWTDWGAFIGYQSLMKTINQDFPNVRALEENQFEIFTNRMVRAEYNREFWIGSMCAALNLSKKYCPLDYAHKYYRHPDEPLRKVISDDKEKERTYYYPRGADKKIAVIGNSFSENITELLSYNFRHTIKFRANTDTQNNWHLNRWLPKIKKFKPDILVIIYNDSGLINTTQQFFQE